jgi:hypothetical protein
MAALLPLAAMFVSSVVSSTRMLLTLLSRECHTDVERDRLPAVEDGNQTKETDQAAATSRASRNSSDALLPRSGEAPSARTAERSRPGGGPPHRRATAPPVPHRIAHAASLPDASLPRTGEENRGRVTS